MTFRQRPPFLPLLAAVVALAATACAHKVTIERRSNGVLHLECEDSLSQCLVAAEVACDRERYTVLRAYDQHDWAGGQPKPGTYSPYIEIRKSEAYVRCGYHASYGPDIDAAKKLELCPTPNEPDQKAKPVLPPPRPSVDLPANPPPANPPSGNPPPPNPLPPDLAPDPLQP